MNRISLSVVSLVLIRNNNGKLYTGFLYIRKRTVPFVHEFTATDQRERIIRGCCAAVAFTTETFARSFRDKSETKWYFPADMRHEKNLFRVFTRVNIYIYVYMYTSMHEVRIIVAISVWFVCKRESDIASAGMCTKRSIEYAIRASILPLRCVVICRSIAYPSWESGDCVQNWTFG